MLFPPQTYPVSGHQLGVPIEKRWHRRAKNGGMLPVVTGALFHSCPLIESLEQIKANPEWNSSSITITIFPLSKDGFLVLFFGVVRALMIL